MAEITWTSATDWALWSWTNADLATVPGAVRIAIGETEAVGISPTHEAASWVEWQPIVLAGLRPSGCSYCIRFKTAETEGGLTGATWSEYIDGVSVDGDIVFDRRTWIRNNAAWDVGPWEQIELTISR